MLLVPLAAAQHHEGALVTVLIQLGVIVAAARLCGLLFKKLGQPAVAGEIAAGILLGPSVFGNLERLAGFTDHQLSRAIFDPAVADIFGILSQLGLILLLFLVGMEFDFSHLKRNHKSATAISVAGIAAPFALGWGLAHAIHPLLEGVQRAGDAAPKPVELGGFALFMGAAMSITAMPVLARMMMEFNVTRTRIGTLTISAAAINDATGWILLAAVSAMVRSEFQLVGTFRLIGLTLAFAAFMFFIARPLLVRWIRWSFDRHQGDLGLNAMAILLIVIFLCSIATSLIGIFAIFGAFILGAVLSDQPLFREAVTRELRNFVMVFFLPIYFTYTGLRTDIGSLGSPALWAIAAAVIAVAIAGKFGGCALAARASGLSWRESLCVGSLMNTRGLMELIVINVGWDLGIIPRSVYCMLVLMAIVTTYMTTPLVRLFKAGTELDALMAPSRFSRRRPASEDAIPV